MDPVVQKYLFIDLFFLSLIDLLLLIISDNNTLKIKVGIFYLTFVSFLLIRD